MTATAAIDLALHHFGLATADFDSPMRWYRNLGYTCVAEAEDEIQGVDLRLLEGPSGGPKIELIRGRGDRSPISRYLSRVGPCIYHMCYEVDLLEDALARLRDTQRVIPIGGPAPAALFDGRRVCFAQIVGVGLMEFLERSP